ncbi:MAG: glycosyltransferase family 61 protein [Nibricoccus sp.]
MNLNAHVITPLRRSARRLDKLLRSTRIYSLAGLRELAFIRTRLQLPRNQLFPLHASQADGVSVRLVEPEETFTRPIPHMPGESVPHPNFVKHSQGTIPSTYVAEIAGARIWGYYDSAILTADGRLIPELSKDMWGDPSIHPIFARARFARPRQLRGRTLSLITPEAAGNYHHWMIDMLPRVGLVQRAGWDLNTFDQILIKHRNYPFQKQVFARLGIDESKIIRVNDSDHFQAESLVVPSFHHDSTVVNSADLNYVRSLFAPSEPAPPRRRLYLGRRDTTHRRVLNDAELQPVLARYGFEDVSLSGLTVEAQARLLSDAEAVVGPNGSALANLIFAQPSCRVIEFFAPAWVVPYNWMIASHVGCDFTALVGNGPRPDPKNAPPGIKDHIELDPALLEKALATLPPLKS